MRPQLTLTHVHVRGVYRNADEGFHSAEGHGIDRYGERIAHSDCRLHATLQVDGDHSTEAAPPGVDHLLSGKEMLGMRRETGIENPLNLRMLFEVHCKPVRIFILSPHPELKRFEASRKKECSKGICTAPIVFHLGVRATNERLGARSNAGDDIAMSAKVLRCTLDQNVYPPVKRLLVDDGGKRNIDHGRDLRAELLLRLAHGGNNLPDVDDAKSWVGRGLEVHESGFRGCHRRDVGQ